MKPEVKTGFAIVGNAMRTENIEIKRENFGAIADLLSDNLYARPKEAILREYMCNAQDAHVEKGIYNTPIKVRLPDPLHPYLEIRDFGPGLSEEMIFDIYAHLVESTKTGSNRTQGMFGLGAKSAYSYTSSFSVTSWYSGTKKTYSLYKTPEGDRNVSLFSVKAKGNYLQKYALEVCKIESELEGETFYDVEDVLGAEELIPAFEAWLQQEVSEDEETGILVTIPIKPADFESIKRIAGELCAFFTPYPDINLEDYYRKPPISDPTAYHKTKLSDGKGFSTEIYKHVPGSGVSSTWKILTGNVLYDVPEDWLRSEAEENKGEESELVEVALSKLTKIRFSPKTWMTTEGGIITAEIGQVDPTPSREQVRLTKRTRLFLNRVSALMSEGAPERILANINNCGVAVNAASVARELYQYVGRDATFESDILALEVEGQLRVLAGSLKIDAELFPAGTKLYDGFKVDSSVPNSGKVLLTSMFSTKEISPTKTKRIATVKVGANPKGLSFKEISSRISHPAYSGFTTKLAALFWDDENIPLSTELVEFIKREWGGFSLVIVQHPDLVKKDSNIKEAILTTFKTSGIIFDFVLDASKVYEEILRDNKAALEMEKARLAALYAQRKMYSSKVFTLKHRNGSPSSSLNWELAQDGIPDGAAYVWIDRFSVTSLTDSNTKSTFNYDRIGGLPSVLRSISELQRLLGCDEEETILHKPLYGVKVNLGKRATKHLQTNCVSLAELAAQLVSKIVVSTDAEIMLMLRAVGYDMATVIKSAKVVRRLEEGENWLKRLRTPVRYVRDHFWQNSTENPLEVCYSNFVNYGSKNKPYLTKEEIAGLHPVLQMFFSTSSLDVNLVRRATYFLTMVALVTTIEGSAREEITARLYARVLLPNLRKFAQFRLKSRYPEIFDEEKALLMFNTTNLDTHTIQKVDAYLKRMDELDG